MVTPKGKALLTKAILALLVLGVLSYGYLPEARCDLETDKDGNPKIVKYIYLSDSRKTATVVLSKGDEGYDVFDDRCQKGMVIGQWQPLKEIARQPPQKCLEWTEHSPWVLSYITDCYTGEREKYLCDHFGKDATCNRVDGIPMPFD